MIRSIPRVLALSLAVFLVSLSAVRAAACTGVVIAKDGHV